jgi:hypothetical protein
MFIWLGYIYAFIYFLQYLVYPVQLVSSKVLIDRGTVRIVMPGAEYLFATWFIFLYRFFKTRKPIYILGLIPFIVILIIMATRQLIASIVLLTLLNIYQSKLIKSKLFVIILIGMAITPFYFLFQGIFDQIFAITSKQQGALNESIRFLAAKYFLFEFNPNPLWVLTGNGMPGSHSEYGAFLYRLSSTLGYYKSDVGIIGDFSSFGILFVAAQIIFLLKLAFYKIHGKYSFVKYMSLTMLLTMFTGAGLRASAIVMICLILYIVDIDKNSKQEIDHQ